jgi:NAD(P)-dependent dehydrogenase (short-subunit alcohol dehydrogenase family)
MSANFDGSVALVTGATSGIGRATALSLAGRGAHVLVSGRDASRGEVVVSEIRASGGKADFLAADLEPAGAARALARQAVEAGGGHVDILVNNADTYQGIGGTTDLTEADLDAAFAVSVKSPFVLVAELAPAMAERGKGAIVNVGSAVADFGLAGMGFYGAAKAAKNLLTKAWAAEFGSRGVRVNSVSVGPTRTEGAVATVGALQDHLAAFAPAARVASPDEIAAVITFLASDDASFVHGAIVAVDGGQSSVRTFGGTGFAQAD